MDRELIAARTAPEPELLATSWSGLDCEMATAAKAKQAMNTSNANLDPAPAPAAAQVSQINPPAIENSTDSASCPPVPSSQINRAFILHQICSPSLYITEVYNTRNGCS